MARKSRKNFNTIPKKAVGSVVPKCLTGIYVRLSVEDNGYKTKDSIENQIAFLKEFIEKNSEELELIQIYVDNGTTGTNFERENWNVLLNDIKSGAINCIIVKDFSRIGRNYIEVGNYLEKIFPFLGVRVVSVNDNFDSKNQSFQGDMLMNSLTNIVNEHYARDISKKVTQTKKTMQKKGELASGILPYGYKKCETDCKKLEADPECADIVRKIFSWRVGGKGCGQIANYLNELALPSPGQYRYMNGCNAFKRSQNTKWKSKHIAGILTNPVYLGHMVQGKTRCSYFEQNGKLRFLPKEDWIIVENTHQALISQEQFDIATKMAEISSRKHSEQMAVHADIPHIDNPLRKKICCGQCGRLLTRRSRVKNGIRDYCYFCNSPAVKINASCTNTHIHEIPLMEAVMKAVDRQMRLLGAWQNQWIQQKADIGFRNSESAVLRKKQELEEKISFLKKRKQELYTAMKEGRLSLDEFGMKRKILTNEQQEYEEILNQIRTNEKTEAEVTDFVGKYRQDVLAIKDDNLPIDLLDCLIEKITIISPERIELTYSFSDSIEKWIEEMSREIPVQKEGTGNA
ncbi:recombinase family protein [Enterocloster bolteae]|uniref:recombinase family protein n=1 Tax=Enterocloster bolteae TaxID=208479 RepID=UPI003AB2B1AD